MQNEVERRVFDGEHVTAVNERGEIVTDYYIPKGCPQFFADKIRMLHEGRSQEEVFAGAEQRIVIREEVEQRSNEPEFDADSWMEAALRRSAKVADEIAAAAERR